MNKSINNTVRNKLKNIRQNLSQDYIQDASIKICQAIQNMEKYIGLYSANNGEIILDKIWHTALNAHKICCFPILQKDNTLIFSQANNKNSMQKNIYNILEPNIGCQKIPLNTLDMICIPLLAFNLNGTRLGMGLGCYDRTLAQNNKAFLLGIGYDFQLQPDIIKNTWDILLHAIITPTTIYWPTS